MAAARYDYGYATPRAEDPIIRDDRVLSSAAREYNHSTSVTATESKPPESGYAALRDGSSDEDPIIRDKRVSSSAAREYSRDLETVNGI